MMFGDNILRIQHDRGFGIEFNATDALKCVNNCQGMIKVACAEEWQESRYSILSPVGKYWYIVHETLKKKLKEQIELLKTMLHLFLP